MIGRFLGGAIFTLSTSMGLIKSGTGSARRLYIIVERASLFGKADLDGSELYLYEHGEGGSVTTRDDCLISTLTAIITITRQMKSERARVNSIT